MTVILRPARSRSTLEQSENEEVVEELGEAQAALGVDVGAPRRL